MLTNHEYLTPQDAAQRFASANPHVPAIHASTIRKWANSKTNPLKAVRFGSRTLISVKSFDAMIKDGWPKAKGTRSHQKFKAKEAKMQPKTNERENVVEEVLSEKVREAGFTCYIDEPTTVKLVDVRRWIGAAQLNGALRICIERLHSELQHVRKPNKKGVPLVKFGQGDHTVEYHEEDC